MGALLSSTRSPAPALLHPPRDRRPSTLQPPVLPRAPPTLQAANVNTCRACDFLWLSVVCIIMAFTSTTDYSTVRGPWGVEGMQCRGAAQTYPGGSLNVK